MSARRWVRVAGLLLVVAAGGWGSAQGCVAVPGGGEVTVAGVGRIVFRELTTDRARDAASFGGEVCVLVEGSDVLFRTERLDVVGLAGDTRLTTGPVTVSVPGWRLTAAGLRGDARALVLDSVAIAGQEALGRADTMAIDLVAGTVAAQALRLVTVSARLDAASARLDGSTLEARDARLTTCECPADAAPARVEAAVARLDVAAGRATVDGGVVVVGAVRWRLPDATTVDAETLAALALPLRVGTDPDVPGAWRFGVAATPIAPNVTAAIAVWTATMAAPARAEVTFESGLEPVAMTLTAASDGVRFAADGAWPLGAGWRLLGSQRVEVGAVDAAVRDAAVRVERTWPSATPTAAWSGLVGATAAVTAQSLAAGEVAGPRLQLDGALDGRWRTRTSSLTVAFTAGAASYPAHGTGQVWWGVAPAWSLDLGALDVTVRHQARWVLGGSPFDVRVDRLDPEQRSDLDVRWAPAAVAGWRTLWSATVRYDWSPDPGRPDRAVGLERLSVRADATTRVAGGTLDLTWLVEAAGALDPRADRDASLAARATWSRGGFELGGRTTYGLAGSLGWRDLTVLAAVPLRLSDAWTLRPFAAVDLLALTAGGGPWLRGHGLDVIWSTCCGTVEAGYRVDDVTGTRTSFALQLPLRPLDPARLDLAGPPAPAGPR